MTIIEWLSNPSDFEAGLELYEKYGSSSSLKQLIRKAGGTASHRKTLIYELSKIKHKDQIIINTPAPISQLAPTILKAPEVINVPGKEPEIVYYPEGHDTTSDVVQDNPSISDPLPSDETIQALEREWRKLYKQCAHLHSTMSSLSPEERTKACLFIVNTFPEEIQPIWDKLNHYKEHGILPAIELITPAPTDPVSLMKRKNALRSYISKAKNGNKHCRPENIPLWEKELLEIEEKLK